MGSDYKTMKIWERFSHLPFNPIQRSSALRLRVKEKGI